MSLTFLARSGASKCELSNGENVVAGENSELGQIPSPRSAWGVTGTAEAWDPGVLIELLQGW